MFIATLPSLTRKDSAKTFSTVWAKERLFKTMFSSLALLFLLRISNMTDTFLSVSVFTPSKDSASCIQAFSVGLAVRFLLATTAFRCFTSVFMASLHSAASRCSPEDMGHRKPNIPPAQ
ncbi:Os02g0194350 [Oryza sativa Japonica Group]|uniref:Os02g0194350 protein n=1 Tax=Oryza sativa subsp. japonica TaxID=39947 RepID=A0A0P0VFY2_ORYSJ|nr:hypothetical protein EE612_009481 [Oryza sativa]BAS77437.1 Os02g0194350 [Oryza sativa Japonica Group]